MDRLSIDEVIEHCNRQTRDYERLNGKTELENADISLNFIKQYWEHRQVAEWLRELKTYKDAEEQGLLLRLPVAEGTNVFCIGSCGEICDDYETDCEVCGEHKVVFCMNFDRNMVEQFGKTVFLTKEQAEQALKQMRE